MEEASAQLSPVGELVVYYLVGYHPANEDTCQEAYDGQEYLSCDEVKPFEQRTAEEYQTVDSAQRQRTERTNDTGQDGDPAKACWNTLGSVMNISDGPLSGLTPTEKAAGNIMSPARMATRQSMTAICDADFVRSVYFEK